MQTLTKAFLYACDPQFFGVTDLALLRKNWRINAPAALSPRWWLVGATPTGLSLRMLNEKIPHKSLVRDWRTYRASRYCDLC